VSDDSTTEANARRFRVRPRLVGFIALVALLLVLVGKALIPDVQFFLATTRTTPVYQPPVLAGQLLHANCTGGFYARDADRVVLTLSAHCADEGQTILQADGAVLGVTGHRASLADCPAGRFCSPSDFMPMILDPAQIPWGHLNLVDFTGGGYKAIAPGARALACGDIHVGDPVEVGGRNWYRTGKVIQIERYEFDVDVIFPCMAIADIEAGIGDSGGAVLVNGQPAGITAREIDGYLGFTPLAEGLDNLGLTLCTDPDCGLVPPSAAPSPG
jgi:hypothetical protein